MEEEEEETITAQCTKGSAIISQGLDGIGKATKGHPTYLFCLVLVLLEISPLSVMKSEGYVLGCKLLAFEEDYVPIAASI
ncbi:hypothetical protein MRB53_004265 [Persea americana]|uniref:Uncharacterized protein n=1 Tax=Persea americana TaxID=3435 RepID=A0ACC2MA39_PERAE|nr:hypothetical protein MRB53_004265 [Persea americana]